MYSAITPRTAIVKEKVRNIRPTMVPYPANGTPRHSQKTEKNTTAIKDSPLKMKPDNDI
jgi:hypothetical protein